MTSRRTWRIDDHCQNPACEWQIVTRDGIKVDVFRDYPAAMEHIKNCDRKEVGK